MMLATDQDPGFGKSSVIGSFSIRSARAPWRPEGAVRALTALRGGGLAAALVAMVSTQAVADDRIAASIVPFTLVDSSDAPRVVVVARFNGHAIRMMVHSNANFFSQLRHSQATAFGVSLVGEHAEYGIDRVGHESGLGMDKGVVGSLAVGGSVDRDAPVSVFEVPQAALGMLGTGWIARNRVIVDFGSRVVRIAPSASEVRTLEASLRRSGRVAIPMAYDPAERLYRVRVGMGGASRWMTVATASPFTVDVAFARAAGLRLGRATTIAGGPTGTRIQEHGLAAPVRVTMAGWTSRPVSVGSIDDTYAYGGAARPADPTAAIGGYLGGQFLTESAAVVDFGSKILWVRR